MSGKISKNMTRKERKPFAYKFVNWRIHALFLVFLVLTLSLIFRLFYLQVANGDYYSALALGQQGNFDEFVLPRGEIFMQDKAGSARYLVATTQELPMVYAVPKEIESGFEEDLLKALNTIVTFEEKDQEVLLGRFLNKDSSFALLARRLNSRQVQAIKELALDGIYIRPELVRFYPANDLAAQVLGFVGSASNEGSGQYGLEEYYNDLLAGALHDESLGASFQQLFEGEHILESGAELELTIDYGLQFIVEKKLHELKEHLNADAASAIFMDPKTGAILAMANVPSFNVNDYSKVSDINVFVNNATQSLFEPGSIFKPITMAAAIDGGAVLPQTTYEDKGVVRIGEYTITNFDGKSRGIQTMTQVLEQSLNTGAIFAQQELGKKKFREYAEAFQLTEPTGIDLAGEALSNINNIKNTNRDINFATASFGQGVAFTPMRLLSSLSAIANNGVIMRPYIVSKVSHAGKEIITQPQATARPITAVSASRVSSMLVSVAENGFDKKASVPGYSVAAKTGTAQVPNKDGPGYSDNTIHSFVGFAPAFNPRFIGLIKVDNPHGIRFAADSLAPAFRELASFILQYYKIPPQ